MSFAKLFDTQRFGQVLALLEPDDKGNPALHWYVEPKGLGVCRIALGFKDTDDGWDAAERALEKADIDAANAAAIAIYKTAFIPLPPETL